MATKVGVLHASFRSWRILEGRRALPEPTEAAFRMELQRRGLGDAAEDWPGWLAPIALKALWSPPARWTGGEPGSRHDRRQAA